MLHAKKNFIIIVIVIHTFSMPSGLCLDCFVCHGKKSKDCKDPFEADMNETVDCQRVRDVGLGLAAAAGILGVPPGHYAPLSQPPHVCFKLNMKNVFIRGCGKPDVCQNYTEADCSICEEDGCNKTSYISPPNAVLLYSAVLFFKLS